MFRKTTTTLLVLLSICLMPLSHAQGIKREDLGRTEKWRIVVDKVMQPVEKWVTKEWMIKEAADAGFNVYSPRIGHDRLDEVRQVTEWCEKYGIFHMPWMRGTLTAPMDDKAKGKRVLWYDGNEQPLWSVNSDEFWDWTTRYIVEYAKMSAENEHIVGVFLDYEDYAPGGRGNQYDLSYDDIIMGKFAASKDLELPKLTPGARKAWLEEKGLHDAFAAFQIEHWRDRCRTLREAVDKHNPAFQFCIYPAPGTLFMREGAYYGWATEAAPLILADASIYGRPSRFVNEQKALEMNRAKLEKRIAVPEAAGIPYQYAGGIDPVVEGADPEFCGKNAVMSSDATDGYWIFYEGPKYDEDHPEYWKWFTWANTAIKEDRFDAQRAPRETPEDWTIDVFGDGEGRELVAPKPTFEMVDVSFAKGRRDNLLLVSCGKGKPVAIELQCHSLGNYESLLAWELRDLDDAKVATGTIPFKERGVVEFTPERDGIYLLGVSAGPCAYSVVRTNVPLAYYTAQWLTLVHAAKRLYFDVPEGIEEFTIAAVGAGAETVRVNVYAPDGELAATGQTTIKDKDVHIKAKVDGKPGVWSLETTRADEGTIEDHRLKLDAKLAPALALRPEYVFKLGE